MNARLRRQLLADATATSHAHPAAVRRALDRGMRRYGNRVWLVYAGVTVIWLVIVGSLALNHPAARALMENASDSTPVTPSSEPTQESSPSTSTSTSSATPSATSSPTLQSISILPPEAISLVEGMEQELSVLGHFSDGSSSLLMGTPAWTSDNDKVIQISNQGIASAVSAGDTTVSVTLGEFTATASVVVDRRVLTGLTISPGPFGALRQPIMRNLQPGQNLTLIAIGTYNDGTSAVVDTVAWSSGDETVATIDGGTVSAIAPGTAIITARVFLTHFPSRKVQITAHYPVVVAKPDVAAPPTAPAPTNTHVVQ